MNSPRTLIHAAALADPSGYRAAPAAIVIEDHQILAAGSPQSIGSLSGAGGGGGAHSGGANAHTISLPNSLIIPALVNAHAHLDLTHIGPLARSPDQSFADWANTVRARRAATDDQIAESVLRGIALSRAGGTAFIGDIAGNRSLIPIQTLRQSNPTGTPGISGTSFIELFGLGRRQSATIEFLQTLRDLPIHHSNVTLGLQPHAPYSCGLDVYRAAAAQNLPLATHLAESLEEIAFVRSAAGPLAQMIKSIGVWDDSITGSNLHPIEHLAPILSRTPFIVAHLNYIEPHHLPMLARWPITVAYCPRASAYFGHPQTQESGTGVSPVQHPPHQYRAMLDANINVALGTDSILCLDTPDRLSILDEMRFLCQRDQTNPITLLRMATLNGASALNKSPALFTFPRPNSRSPQPTAGLLALDIDPTSAQDPLHQALLNNSPPRWVIQ